MTTWEERFAKREVRIPAIIPETCWRMAGPSGRILACTICRVATGLEVQCGYEPDDFLRSQYAVDIGTAREIAEQWRQVVIVEERLKKGAPPLDRSCSLGFRLRTRSTRHIAKASSIATSNPRGPERGRVGSIPASALMSRRKSALNQIVGRCARKWASHELVQLFERFIPNVSNL